MAIGSYAAYKLRERRRPHAEPQPSDGGLLYFERIHADDER
jgi:hypothetical protein